MDSTGDTDNLAPIWQRRFAFYRAYGLPNTTPQSREAFKALPFGSKFRLNSNIPAFFFGPFYFLVKGMWRKAVTLLGAALGVGLMAYGLGLPPAFSRALGFGFAALEMTLANYAYFLHATQGSQSWNPFEGFGRRR